MNCQIIAILTKYLIIILVLSNNHELYCQHDSSSMFQKQYNLNEYNNSNFKWMPFGLVRKLDSNNLFCGIITNVKPEFSNGINESASTALWKNLNDTSRDFSTNLLLLHLYNMNCCDMIENYYSTKDSELLWRRNEKDYWIKYWKGYFDF